MESNRRSLINLINFFSDSNEVWDLLQVAVTVPIGGESSLRRSVFQVVNLVHLD